MHPRDNGFTLIEVLVAFMILALSLTVLLRIFSGGMSNVALSGDYARAMLLAETQLASTGVSEPLMTGTTEGEWDERFRWQRIVEPYHIQGKAPNPAPPASLFHIHVVVEWSHKGRQREIRISSLRLQPQPLGGKRG